MTGESRDAAANRTLLVLRHASAGWDSAQIPDHERELTPHGVREARWVGLFLRQRRLKPDRLLCSSARRARSTAAEVMEGLGCLLYTSPSPRDLSTSRMPSSA